jgi:hypothetical protein
MPLVLDQAASLPSLLVFATPGLNMLCYTLKSPLTKQLLRGAK